MERAAFLSSAAAVPFRLSSHPLSRHSPLCTLSRLSSTLPTPPPTPPITQPRLAVSAVIFRRSPTPIPSKNQYHEVLLIQRGNSPSRGLWSLPGGKLRAGESIAAATLRELREETGLEKVQLGNPFTAREAIVWKGGAKGGEGEGDGELEFHYVIVTSVGFVAEIEAGKVRAGDDAADARWVNPSETKGLDCTPGLDDVIANALSLIRKKVIEDPTKPQTKGW